MSSRRWWTLPCVVVLAAGGAANLVAQQPERPRLGPELARRPAPEFGVRGAYDFDLKAGGVGAQLRVPLLNVMEIIPSGDYYFVSGSSAWQASLDLAVRWGFRQVLYAGGGGALVRRNFVTGVGQTTETSKAGTNLFVGAAIPRLSRARFRPYAEMRWTFVSNYPSEMQAMAGINVWFGSGR